MRRFTVCFWFLFIYSLFCVLDCQAVDGESPTTEKNSSKSHAPLGKSSTADESFNSKRPPVDFDGFLSEEKKKRSENNVPSSFAETMRLTLAEADDFGSSFPDYESRKEMLRAQGRPEEDLLDGTQEIYDPLSPLVRCDFLPLEFLECEEPLDLEGNQTAYEVNGYGCYRYGGQRWEDVQNTSVQCNVLPGIECHGKREFRRDGFPCVKFTGHYFLTTLLFSVLMGLIGLDRFCLGYTCIGVGKLFTLGGLGVWWIVDVVLLITGNLGPWDESNWMPSY